MRTGWMMLLVLSWAAVSRAEPELLLPDNLKTLGCAAPDTKLMFVRSNQPGNVFWPGDRVDLTLKLAQPVRSLTLEVLEIAWSELTQWHPHIGQSFGFTFRVNNNQGPSLLFGSGKSAVKTNGLSLHPYWEGKPSCSVQWTLRP